jgi:G3E family GTPase
VSEPGPEFIILTGFLGSGKTTLLRDFVAGPDAAATAIIVNEVGEIGLDGAILRESGAGLPVAMLANGCICCQMGSDLALTVDMLLAAERPPGAAKLRRVVLETSGLSKPGPVLRQLASLAEYRLRVAVVATFDALRGTDVLAFEEAAAQWAAANRIVVTKTDLLDIATMPEVREQISALNPLAEIVLFADRAMAVTSAFAALNPAARAPAPAARTLRASHPRITVALARPQRVIGYDDLATWLDNLAGALGERLLRVKGLVRVAESEVPLLVQSVGTLFAPPRKFRDAAPDAASFLVVIARDVTERELADVPPMGAFVFSGSAASTA